MLSFKTAFSLFYFILIKRLFSSSLLSAIRVALSVYPRLLIFLPAILIPACDSPSLAFHMMYSVYKLNKQGDNIQTCLTHFPILIKLEPVNFSKEGSNCSLLNHIQVSQETDKVAWCSHL